MDSMESSDEFIARKFTLFLHGKEKMGKIKSSKTTSPTALIQRIDFDHR